LNHSKILIIGGNAKRRNRHAMELETHGYQVECADSNETAMQVYLAEPPALVLFAVDEHDGEVWDVYRRLTRDYPLQQKGFALSGSQRLCRISMGGAAVINEQTSGDLIAVVEGLIGTVRRTVSRLSEDHLKDQQEEIGATSS
jgi:CheY-like chemotaxis protein